MEADLVLPSGPTLQGEFVHSLTVTAVTNSPSKTTALSSRCHAKATDNAVAENFFGHFKEEFLRQQTFTSMTQFQSELDKYVHWFNHQRIQLKLEGLSPVQYRTQSLANLETTPY